MIHSIDGVGSEAARPIKAGMLGSGATPSAAATNVTTGQATNDQAQDLTSLCASIYERVVAFLSISANDHFVLETQQQTSKALLVLEDALDQYSLDQLSFSYNGGKDCLVLLILYLAALHAHSRKTSTTLPSSLNAVYIVTPHPFKEVEDFVNESQMTYRLDLAHYHKPMREGFLDYLAERPQVRAIFVGTRRTDPFAKDLKHFDPTDRGWPEFVRVHPVIDWHYANVWTFLRHLQIPYCSLYDAGFTSLGSSLDTHPNPVLKIEIKDDATGQTRYRPAYELVHDDEERLGRETREA